MRGQLTEELVIAKIQQKCDIKRDPKYDHTYKLDFIIDRFQQIDKLLPIGVQVTINPDDAYKQKVFLAERNKRTLVDRSIYIKVDPGVDIDSYGAELIYQSIVAFAFQRDMLKHNVIGVRINPDVSYEFFPLVEASARRGNGAPLASGLLGRITKYFPNNGFGFIASDEGDFFFHISDVLEENLKTEVLPNAEIESEGLKHPIAVTFNDVGVTRDGADKPTAKGIKRVSPEEAPSLFEGLPQVDIEEDEASGPGNSL